MTKYNISFDSLCHRPVCNIKEYNISYLKFTSQTSAKERELKEIISCIHIENRKYLSKGLAAKSQITAVRTYKKRLALEELPC